MATEDDVRELALALPETTERPSYGTPAFRVRDKPFARMREDRAELVLWLGSLDEKELLLAADPGTFFTTPHYDGYAMVLVRLPAVDRDELLELLTEAWLVRAPKRLAAQLERPDQGERQR